MMGSLIETLCVTKVETVGPFLTRISIRQSSGKGPISAHSGSKFGSRIQAGPDNHNVQSTSGDAFLTPLEGKSAGF